jgi:hypothetical protein
LAERVMAVQVSFDVVGNQVIDQPRWHSSLTCMSLIICRSIAMVSLLNSVFPTFKWKHRWLRIPPN